MASPVCKKRKTTSKSHGSTILYCTRSTVRQLAISTNGSRSNSDNDVGPFFCRLPLELITNILSYLDAPSLACCGSTCKKLRSYCDLMWEPLCNRLCVKCQPRILCVKTSRMNSIYRYDNAVKLCTSQSRCKTSAVRNWLCSKERCVVCYRNGSQKVKRDCVTLCETCHPLFYRRKCHAKEEFSLTDKDLQSIMDSESRQFLVSDLITIARNKYGSHQGLQARLQERKQVKEKRESENQCALVTRESQVVSALREHGSSYEDVSSVDAKPHPYVLYHALSAEAAAKWLVARKSRQDTRCKALEKEIKIRTSRCKRCQAKVDHSGPRSSKCRHISQAEAKTMMRLIQQNFKEDIIHYSKYGLLYLEPGACDDQYKSVQELMARHERKCDLQLELDKLKVLWPDLLNGCKDPIHSPFAQDFIYKGVAHLENSVCRSSLRRASDVADEIKTRATGRDSRKNEILQELSNNGIICEVKELKLQSRKLIEDFIENSAVVRRQHIVACSAFETMRNVALIEGHNLKDKEEPTSVTQRCARIYAECNPKPGYKSVQNQRKKILLSCLNIESLRKLGSNKQSCRQSANDFINCGSTTSLFGYKINTPNAVASVIQLKKQILG